MRDEPAFPTLDDTSMDVAKFRGGMSLRDYFAAKAMQSMLLADTDNGRFRDTESRTAEFAYRAADAMLAQRDKGVR